MPTPSTPSYLENQTCAQEIKTKICVYKTCPFNREPQPISAFCKCNHTRDRLHPWCATCRSVYRKMRGPQPRSSRGPWPNDPELNKAYRRLIYSENKDKLNARRRENRAKEKELKGFPPKQNKITFEAVKERWEKWKTEHPEFAKRKAPQPQDAKAEYNGWARKGVYRSKHRAAERDIPFDMEESDLNDPATGKLPVFCSILPYIRLDYCGGPDKRAWASIDRIKPKLGYAKGNVRVISMAANMAKSDGDGDIFPMPKPVKTKLPNNNQPSLFDDL